MVPPKNYSLLNRKQLALDKTVAISTALIGKIMWKLIITLKSNLLSDGVQIMLKSDVITGNPESNTRIAFKKCLPGSTVLCNPTPHKVNNDAFWF